MRSKTVSLPVEFCNLDCHKVNIGSHRSRNLMDVEAFVDVLLDLIIGSASLTWQGRQLMQYINGSNTYAYAYNVEGIRTSKTRT